MAGGSRQRQASEVIGRALDRARQDGGISIIETGEQRRDHRVLRA